MGVFATLHAFVLVTDKVKVGIFHAVCSSACSNLNVGQSRSVYVEVLETRSELISCFEWVDGCV